MISATIISYFLIILIVSVFIKIVWDKRHVYLLSWKLPGPFALPVIGNALHFLCKDEDIFQRSLDLINNYPSPNRVWFGPKFTIMFHDVYHAEKIMSSLKFAYKDDVYKFLEVGNGLGLITSSGPKWKRDRRLMGPIFLKRNMAEYFSIVLRHSKYLVKVLEKEIDRPSFSVHKYLHRCASDIVNESILGVKTNAQDGSLDKFLNAIDSMYILVHSRIVKTWLHYEWIFKLSTNYKKQTHCMNIISDFMKNVSQSRDGSLYFDHIASHRAYQQVLKNHSYNSGNTEPRSFLDKMLDIKADVPDYATEEEMVHHMTTLYTASEDTAYVMSSFILVTLGMYPAIQNKIVEELNSVLGHDRTRDLELEDIGKLSYLEMCIKDVLRLFPIAPFIMRKCVTDCQIDDIFIPKNCSLIVSIYGVHRDPKLWEKPNEFYPEHFLPEAVEKRNPYAFMPFSAGPRACLGKAFAYQVLKTLIATILQKYVVESDCKLEEMKLKTDISVRMKDDCYPIRIRRRQ